MKRFCTIIVVLAALNMESVAAEMGPFVAGAGRGDSSFVVYNPLIAGVSSALIPGSGQIYTKKYLKAGTFLALEAITASVTYYWYKTSQIRTGMAASLLDEVRAGSGIDSAKSYQDYLLMEHNVAEADSRFRNALTWTIGGYVFNVLDAVGGSKFFNNGDARDPLLAGWLSAVPGLGLGQLYNGSLSKAGMIMMTQFSLGIVAYNNHKLMKDAQMHKIKMIKYENNYNNPAEFKELNNQDTLKYVISQEFKNDWASRERNAFQNRNTYMWYSLFFYFYGILDAVVDAHLHDYNDKMRVYPDLVVYSDGAWLKLNMNF